MNPYMIILSFFLLAGLATSAWGWAVIARGRRTLRWPSVEGTISQCAVSDDDSLPQIEFSYSVAGRDYRCEQVFPGGTTPSQQLVASYVLKYPVGAKVKAHYDPARPEHATLEPGLARGDWMIFVLGVIATIFGIIFLLFGYQDAPG